MTVLHAGGKFDHVELQGLRRSARRRRLGRQRAVRLAQARDPARRQGLLPGVPPRRSRRRELQADRRHRSARHQGHVQARPEIFKNVLEFCFEHPAQRLRELAYLNSGLRSSSATSARTSRTSSSSRAASRSSSPISTRTRRRVYDKPIARRRASIDGIAGRHRDAVERRLLRADLLLHQHIKNHDGGTHLTGFRQALTRTVNTYAQREQAAQGR